MDLGADALQPLIDGRTTSASGGSAAPVAGVVKSSHVVFPLPEGTCEKSDDHGPRVHPITGEGSTHIGLDLSAPEGTPILAAADGTVTFAGPSGRYGELIVVEHLARGFDRRDRPRAHVADRHPRRPGDRVSAGQHIGDVGSSGRARARICTSRSAPGAQAVRRSTRPRGSMPTMPLRSKNPLAVHADAQRVRQGGRRRATVTRTRWWTIRPAAGGSRSGWRTSWPRPRPCSPTPAGAATRPFRQELGAPARTGQRHHLRERHRLLPDAVPAAGRLGCDELDEVQRPGPGGRVPDLARQDLVPRAG